MAKVAAGIVAGIWAGITLFAAVGAAAKAPAPPPAARPAAPPPAAAAPVPAPPGWAEFTPAERDFSALFPGSPLASAAPMSSTPGATLRTYLVQAGGGMVFSVSVMTYPKGSLPVVMTAADYANLVRLFGDGIGIKLRSQTGTMVSGRQGVEAVFDRAETGEVMVFRTVAIGDRIFSIIFGGPRGTETSPQAQRFVASLRLLQGPTPR
jgi:hypothetical protein